MRAGCRACTASRLGAGAVSRVLAWRAGLGRRPRPAGPGGLREAPHISYCATPRTPRQGGLPAVADDPPSAQSQPPLRGRTRCLLGQPADDKPAARSSNAEEMNTWTRWPGVKITSVSAITSPAKTAAAPPRRSPTSSGSQRSGAGPSTARPHSHQVIFLTGPRVVGKQGNPHPRPEPRGRLGGNGSSVTRRHSRFRAPTVSPALGGCWALAHAMCVHRGRCIGAPLLPAVGASARPVQPGRAEAAAGQPVLTGRHPRGKRQRCKWRAGPGCRGRGRSGSWFSGQLPAHRHTHLWHVFAKLGVPDRAALAAVVHHSIK
jgi:hypothetical protein